MYNPPTAGSADHGARMRVPQYYQSPPFAGGPQLRSQVPPGVAQSTQIPQWSHGISAASPPPAPGQIPPSQLQWQAPLTDPFGNRQMDSARSAIGGQHVTSKGPSVQAEEDYDFENEPPLLQELGIIPQDILRRMLCVLSFHNVGDDLMRSMDMTGPVLILLGLGCSLLLAGKVHFGYVYAVMSGGTLAIWGLLNMMSTSPTLLSMHRALSVLGYGLLPILLGSLMAPFVGHYKYYTAAVAVLWSTLTASRFVQEALQMKQQRLLVGYPILLFYGCFALIVTL